MIGRAIGVFIALVLVWWGAYPTASQFFYDGDGELTVYGYWPFVSYDLTLPEHPWIRGQQHHYTVSRYSSGSGDYVQLCFRAKEPYDFTLSKMRARMRITRGKDIEVLSIDEPLNAPDQFAGLTEAESRSLRAKGYKYWSTYRGESRTILTSECFTVHTYPYGNLDFDWWESYKIEVSLSDVEAELADVQAHVRIFKGWK